MKNFKFTWLNCGIMKIGYDLFSFSIEIKYNEKNPTITFSTGDKMGVSVIDRTFKGNNKEILDKLSKIKIPDKNAVTNGCDGDAWKIEVDGKVLNGYLDRPQWLNEIKEIINFEKIFKYVDKKRKAYLDIK